MKIFKILLILALELQVGFAEGESGDDYNVYLKNPSTQYRSITIVNDGKCGECDEVKDGYKAIFDSYDSRTGTTYCSVVLNTNLNHYVGTANKQVKSCAYENNISNNLKDELKNIENSYKNRTIIKSSIAQDFSNTSLNGNLTFSKFMVGLLTLDSNIIDRQKTATTGTIMLKDGIKLKGYDSVSLTTDYNIIKSDLDELQKKYENQSNTKDDMAFLGDAISLRSVGGNYVITDSSNALKGFNKNNMAYFSDLFGEMDKIYLHIQVFFFVLIGGFFVMQIGASKIQAYLENRGESEGKQPYLHKFYIPLLMVGIFFMPIPEGNGHNSTVMQNMIRYFAQYSTTIADMAHSVGAKVYMDKIYKSMGGFSETAFKNIKLEADKKDFDIKQNKKIMTNFNRACDDYMNSNNPTYSKVEKDGKIYDCIAYHKTAMNLANNIDELDSFKMLINKAENYNANYTEVLTDIDKYFALRIQELGWIDIALTPTASILVETFTLAKAGVENATQKQQRENSIKEHRHNDTLRAYTAKGNGVDNQKIAKESIDNSVNESMVGYWAGRLVWMMLPGAMALKDFIYDASSMVIGFVFSALGAMVGSITGAVSGITIPGLSLLTGKLGGLAGGTIGSLIGSAVAKLTGPFIVVGSYIGATILMEWTFDMIPLLATSTACLVALVGYLVSLCKYFYISPFVTAWAMATKRTDKIIDFLLAGLAIFIKPILIVLFVYLGLFMHTLVAEFFLFISTSQFTMIQSDWHDFHTNFIVGAISGLLKIFGMLGSSYIIWKLIVSGPAWALGMIGLDGKQDDMIAQGLENNLARRAFVA